MLNWGLESDSDQEATDKIQNYIAGTPDKIKKFQQSRKHMFACQKSPEQQTNLNSYITEQLEILEKNSLALGDKWRGFAYGKAIRILRSSKIKITTVEDARKLPGIGTKISEKVSFEIQILKLIPIKDSRNLRNWKT